MPQMLLLWLVWLLLPFRYQPFHLVRLRGRSWVPLDKRLVLWVSNLLRMVTMSLMFVSLLLDRTNVWSLFGLMFLTSLIGQFFIPAEGSSIPLLVGERDLMPALSF